MEPLTVLSVCTGNICRSPLSEYLLRNALDGEHFRIASAGTHAVIHGSVPDQQVKIAQELGLYGIMEHRPHQVTANDIRDADVILTATLRHRRRVVRTVPLAANRTFTMQEFAHLIPHVSETELMELLSMRDRPMRAASLAVHHMRGIIPQPAGEDSYDIADPYGENAKAYRRSAEQLVEAHSTIIEFLKKVEGYAVKLDAARSLPPKEAEAILLSARLRSNTAPTLGRAISIGRETVRTPGRHSFSLPDTDGTKNNQRRISTPRSADAPRATRGKHRRYAK